MRFFAIFVILFAAGFYYAQHYSADLAGAMPLLHWGIPYGFTMEDLKKANIKGKTFLVTGANAGLGFSTAKLIAQNGGRVIMGCRNAQKCEKAISEIRKLDFMSPSQVLAPTTLDLSQLSSVRAFAEAVLKDKEVQSGNLHSLILNAGFMAQDFELTSDGLESSFMGNHLGHFELFDLLKDALKPKHVKSEPELPRTVVVVSSGAHVAPRGELDAGVPLTKDEVNDQNHFDSFTSYGTAKLMNILFANEIDRRFYSEGIVSTSVHPGMVRTDFLNKLFGDGKGMNSMMDPVFRVAHKIQDYISWTSDEAALTIVASAVKPIGHGFYTVPIHRAFTPSNKAQNKENAKKLWDFSAELSANIK
mmetsp:Transcript_12374/g.15346  ORF Transcript_12374/g.15346 Transcript_12374/m.15346 type:complete len:361 (-) Transcript_12374:126-1208(-)|eukprot:CAMPEP_0204826244 /NCGR_PEP_ID=MMETSP1346-20131115/3972_1 /ASSEMBLY_ACC=CAM_ASM_000771 /TAXON_ID=215587 /ORGANISM="Aplanochytrium stocchinoi, Strain GSBS06" /LENGTH=360 /DNA_ID=CAMNT_0051954175 /DNA_START=178 /DNA_END=1260 /DNA_ORIENTATION=-